MSRWCNGKEISGLTTILLLCSPLAPPQSSSLSRFLDRRHHHLHPHEHPPPPLPVEAASPSSSSSACSSSSFSPEPLELAVLAPSQTPHPLPATEQPREIIMLFSHNDHLSLSHDEHLVLRPVHVQPHPPHHVGHLYRIYLNMKFQFIFFQQL